MWVRQACMPEPYFKKKGKQHVFFFKEKKKQRIACCGK